MRHPVGTDDKARQLDLEQPLAFRHKSGVKAVFQLAQSLLRRQVAGDIAHGAKDIAAPGMFFIRPCQTADVDRKIVPVGMFQPNLKIQPAAIFHRPGHLAVFMRDVVGMDHFAPFGQRHEFAPGVKAAHPEETLRKRHPGFAVIPLEHPFVDDIERFVQPALGITQPPFQLHVLQYLESEAQANGTGQDRQKSLKPPVFLKTGIGIEDKMPQKTFPPGQFQMRRIAAQQGHDQALEQQSDNAERRRHSDRNGDSF
ncbi:hypothetical protein SDC9_122031 [bioreactor metagenome]|uniref:Uncharacterized protein n=1 Tax=bioreactor metagenome TaxID=1076179 RepID=A0A645CDP2_9ZZZZ